jgi:hypothetical protein
MESVHIEEAFEAILPLNFPDMSFEGFARFVPSSQPCPVTPLPRPESSIDEDKKARAMQASRRYRANKKKTFVDLTEENNKLRESLANKEPSLDLTVMKSMGFHLLADYCKLEQRLADTEKREAAQIAKYEEELKCLRQLVADQVIELEKLRVPAH